MLFDYAVSALLTLFVVVDPVGLTPIFLAVTDGLPRTARRIVAVRASIIAGAILAGLITPLWSRLSSLSRLIGRNATTVVPIRTTRNMII